MGINKILLFGITQDIIGATAIEVDSHIDTVANLKIHLQQNFPALKKLKSLVVAVNQEYANDATEIHTGDEIALIPPVSGG